MEFLRPFVLPVEAHTPDRVGAVDLYLPGGSGKRPAVLVVHGGPFPPQVRPGPWDWPVYRGYGSLLAANGLAGATVGHRLHTPADYPVAAGDVEAAVSLLRAHDAVAPDRIGLWFFSGSGLLAADWLRDPPAWLRVLALTYPVLTPMEGWTVAERFRPVDAVGAAGDLPIVLTRVGREIPAIAAGQDIFVASAAEARLEIIEVPQGHHGFDYLDDDPESRAAIERAAELVLAATH